MNHRTSAIWVILIIAIVASCGQPRPVKIASPSADTAKPVTPKTLESAVTEVLSTLEPTLAGVKSGLDSNSVFNLLGRPDSIHCVPDFRDSGAVFVSLWYPGFVVVLGSSNFVAGVEISKPGIPTSRGLQVGDSLSKAIRLYGQPASFSDDELFYQSPSDEDQNDAFIVAQKDSLVSSIFSGHIYD